MSHQDLLIKKFKELKKKQKVWIYIIYNRWRPRL